MLKTKLSFGRILLLGLPLSFLIVFYFYPLGKIFSLSFGQIAQNWFTGVPWKVVNHALGFTLYQASLSTIITMLIGLPSAYLFGRLDFPAKNALRIATTLPFILPTVVVAAGFSSLIGPQGWLNLALMHLFSLAEPVIKLQNSLAAILLAHVFYNTSIVIRVVGGAWAQLDPRIEDAAKTLGAAPWESLKKISLPLLMPSIVSAILLVFLFDFTSFGVILMMGGPQFTTLEVEIYIQTMQFLNLRLASILSLIQLAATMIVSTILIRVSNGEWSVPVMPKIKGEGIHKPKKIWEKILSIITIFVIIVVLIMPVVGLVFRSVLNVDLQGDEKFSQYWKIGLGYYQELFVNRRQSFFYVPPIQALKNSLLIAVAASFLSIVMGLMLASGLSKRTHFSRIIEFIVLLPLGTSAVTLGLGFFTAFSKQMSAMSFFPALLPAAHSLIALPFVMRVIQPAQQSIPENIRQAAQSLGASPKKVWRYIEIPIIWRALMTSAVYAFTISLGEFGATSFLTRPDQPTLPIAIYRYLTLPGSMNYGQAMAMAVIILIVCTGCMIALDQLQFSHTTKT